MFYKGQMVTSADFYEGVAALNGLTLLYEDVLDGTCVLGYDVVLHLHGFHDDEDITGVDALTYGSNDLDDVAGQGSVDGLGTCGGSSLGGSSLGLGSSFDGIRSDYDYLCLGSIVPCRPVGQCR